MKCKLFGDQDLITFFLSRWKIFLLSLVCQLLITTLLHLGVRAPAALGILSLPFSQVKTANFNPPLFLDNQDSSKKENSLKQEQSEGIEKQNVMMLKIKEKGNSFKLHRDETVVTSVEAASFDQFFAPQQLSAYAVVDFDTGRVLAEKNLEKKEAIASITKIMTAVVALDLASPEEKFEVSKHAASIPPTSIGVVPGQRMKLEELLHALLLTSANDSAEVIKEGIDKRFGQGSFMKAMNEKAKFIGLQSSHFENPQGFDGNKHYSSAADLSLLSHYVLESYPLVKEIVGKDYQLLPADEDHKQFDLYNWNGLLGVYPGIFGIKIGNTDQAGYTTTVVAERDGKRVFVVVLGAPGILERDLWAAQLLDTGFSKLGVPAAQVSEESLREKYATWRYWG